jgi:hypothetical protein
MNLPQTNPIKVMRKTFLRGKVIRIFSFLSLYGLALTTINAEPITSWTDEMGVRHFSSKKEKNVKEATQLPEIEKYDIDSNIETLEELSNKTCVNRGGIDCEAGPTDQGNVICADGFKGSIEKYKSACTEIKLVASIDIPERSHASKLFKTIPIAVTVRNESRIEAEDITVKVRFLESLKSERRIEYLLEGPDTIPAFGIAHYTYSGRLIDARIVRRGTAKVSCRNCWDPLKKDEFSINQNKK